MRKFVISVNFCCKFATFSDFKRSEIFSRNSYFLKKKPNFCKLWVILLCQSVSMETFHPFIFSCYNETFYSVSKSSSFFQLILIFQYLWQFFLLQSHSAASFLPLGIFEKKQVFFSKNPYTCDEKTRFWTSLEILFFQSLFTGFYLPLAISKKLIIFFRETHMFFQTANFLHVLRNFSFSVVFYCNFSTLKF